LIGLSNLQLLLSSGTFILNLSYNVSGTWIEHGWLSLLWEFLTYAKLQYHASNIFWTPNKQRENDSFLMEFFLTITKNISILKAINRCRVYLQLILVSDIATADGRKLLPEVKQGSIPDWRSSLKWPHQGRPSKTDWNVWSQLLETGNHLIRPLGRWDSCTHQEWDSYYHPTLRQHTSRKMLGGL